MNSQVVNVGNSRIEILSEKDRYLGLGEITIDGRKVRSGRLPMDVYSQTFSGLELCRLDLDEVQIEDDEVRVQTTVRFRPLMTKLMRDHSFDPIHDTDDWDVESIAGVGNLALVLQPAAQDVYGTGFGGFRYHYEYRSDDVGLFWLMDRSSWELGGQICGATVYNQSSCSDPVVEFEDDTAWTTEGIIHWDDENSKTNPVMTHNLPRWASHQAFDFQFKGDATLLGVYERVDLIRSLLKREPEKAELKTFDKHIFDETCRYSTSPKKILLNTEPKTETDQRNLWTWTFDIVADEAREQFGLEEEPILPRLNMNYWEDFTIDTYYEDLLPAAKNIGARTLFIDNVNKSAYTEDCPNPGEFHWNMCCGHEYEPAPSLGGSDKLQEFVDRCEEAGITPFSWTNNDQALSSPINDSERDDRGWFVRMEDSRLKYGGAYTNVMSILNFSKKGPREYWVESLKRIRRETGLKAYLFDSFYNLGFMPVDYSECRPTTQWKGTLAALKELQDADVHFMIESLGPFGEPQHGCPESYNMENLFACYKICMGTGYTTIPTGQEKRRSRPWPAEQYARILGHMTKPGHRLFYDEFRIDELFSEEHKRLLNTYYEQRPFMHRRFLQEDGQAVIWHDAVGERATIWNFADREVRFSGDVTDVTTGEKLRGGETCELKRCHVYSVVADELPETLAEE
ncbi:MAG: hypothetical protein ACLFWL_08275 [Candidatus Brocadiia bacterium]